MSKKQLISLLIILIVSIFGCYFLLNNKSKSWDKNASSKRTDLFENLKLSKVAKVAISKNNKNAVVAKVGDNWLVETSDNYPADFAKIKNVVMKIKDLKMTDKLTVGKSQYAKLQLDEKSAMKVVLSDSNDKIMAELLLGKEHMKKSTNPNPMFGGAYPDGRFVLVKGIENPILINETLNSLTEKSSSWLNSDFIKPEKIKSIKLDSDEKWELTKENESAEFAISVNPPEGKEFDKSKASSIESTFRYFSFNDISKGKLESKGSLTIETFDNFKYILSLGEKDSKKYLSVQLSANFENKRVAVKDEKKEDAEKLDKEFADNLKKLNDKLLKEQKLEGWLFEINSSTYNDLMKKSSDFFKEIKKEEKK